MSKDPKTGIKRSDLGNPVAEKSGKGSGQGGERREPQFGSPRKEPSKPSGPIISPAPLPKQATGEKTAAVSIKPLVPAPKEEINKTQVVRPSTATPGATPGVIPGQASRPSEKTQIMQPNKDQQGAGPVTGWLVVLEGPGKGNSVPVSYGVQSLGRGVGQDLALSFGDSAISEKRHATIAYDPDARLFWLAHAEGRNLTKVAGQPVLSQRQLKDGDIIEVGSTKLRFVAFCGPDFAWS